MIHMLQPNHKTKVNSNSNGNIIEIEILDSDSRL